MLGDAGEPDPPQASAARAAVDEHGATSEAADARKQGAVSPGQEGNHAPHFVAPLSYLRPLSRGQQQQPPSGGSDSRPGTRHKPMTPYDREQREGLVSRALLIGNAAYWRFEAKIPTDNTTGI